MSTIASQRIKPTPHTKFHIDYDWWKDDEGALRVYLISHLNAEQRAFFAENRDTEAIDWVDPVTAEVQRVDALETALREAAQSPDFISVRTSLVDAVFRVFLANGNKPLSPIELSEIINRPPMTILRTFAGRTVYKGIRPALDADEDDD